MFTYIKEFSKFLMLAGFVSMTAACEQVQSEVVSFSSLTPQAPGGAYYVLPSQEQASSVEFLQHTQSIGRRLSKKGWYQVANESEAKFIVLLDYGVAGSTSKTGSINKSETLKTLLKYLFIMKLYPRFIFTSDLF